MSSGGGKASTPKLLDENLKSKQFYRVLDLISEGPIYRPVDQTHPSSFMLNKTPITTPNGNISINGISAAWRRGSGTQAPMKGFSAIEATTVVNTEVKFATPLVRTYKSGCNARTLQRWRYRSGSAGYKGEPEKHLCYAST